jgi:hypothetical protein
MLQPSQLLLQEAAGAATLERIDLQAGLVEGT